MGGVMRIAVIGAGNVGGTLGRRLAGLGHEVVFGLRHPEKGAAGVKGDGAFPAGASIASPADAVRGAEAVLLATPWAAVANALRELGEGALDGVVLLDATNPVAAGLKLDVGPNGESAAERIQAMAPRARVVKVFNTTGYNIMQNPLFNGVATSMFYAGDDADAKRVAATLSKSLGFDPVDAGPLTRARELEHLALLWISLAFSGLGREIAFQLMKR
jgi:predicted dinucleotide-binding enzyme